MQGNIRYIVVNETSSNDYTISFEQKSISNIETCLFKLVDALEKITSVKALNQEIDEIKSTVLKLSEERNIFNKK